MCGAAAPRPDMIKSLVELPIRETDGSPGPFVALCATGKNGPRFQVALFHPPVRPASEIDGAVRAEAGYHGRDRRMGQLGCHIEIGVGESDAPVVVAVDRHSIVGGGEAVVASAAWLAVCF